MPRGSGTAPTSEEDRKKESKKIDDYRSLVGSVNTEVGIAPNRWRRSNLKIVGGQEELLA